MIFSEGSNLQNSVFGKVQNPIKMFLEKRGEAFEAQSIADKIFDQNKSTHFGEQFSAMTAMEGFRPVGEGGAYPDDHMQESYSKLLVNMTWKDRFTITEEMIDDATTMDLRQQPAAFVAGYYRTRERFAAALIGGAASGSAAINFYGKSFETTGADGLCVFSKVHPSKLGKGTQSNAFSNELSAAAIGMVETQMHLFKGDQGEILDVAPDTIIIPDDYALKNTLFAALGADKDPNTSNNGANYLFGRWNIIVWPYLNQFLASGAKPWIMLDSKYNEAYKTAVWLNRKDLTVKSDVDPNTDANIWKGSARFTAGFNDWRGIACGGFSGGTALT